MKTKTIINPAIQRLTQKMLTVGNPLKIILFGSRARGDSQPGSDYDFLIIEPSDEKRYKRAAKYRRALKNIPGAKDILVWTPEEVTAWQEVPNSFIATVLTEGILVYEK